MKFKPTVKSLSQTVKVTEINQIATNEKKVKHWIFSVDSERCTFTSLQSLIL